MRFHLMVCLSSLFAVALSGCVPSAEENSTPQAPQPANPKEQPKPAAKVKRVATAKNIELEIDGEQRRVRVTAEVCNRDKQTFLEQLMTRARRKTHEAILAADIDVRHLHAALTLAGAEAGKPVQFRPKLVPPSGTTVKVFLEYKKDGKDMRVPGQSWILNKKTGKQLETDWVFAGSVLYPDPDDPDKKKTFYGANEGDVITIVNFETSCLDVPFLSTKDNAEDFVPNTERIPAVGTAVVVVLEPVLPQKKK